MSNFQQEMNHVVDGFVAQVTELARRAALNTLEATFASHGVNRGPAVAPPRSAAPVGRPRGRGAKRRPEDLDALCTQFASFVKSHPGLRIEQINKELGTTTKDLALPIRKLIAEGKIAAKGQKRSTSYFPGRKAR
ncbi:MAG TPA: hypothetical protein VHT91_11695 [Kofleriaceae bacterium]|jgi:hypothetical protein|nr:hypothetical protein [Kofleriaceae bacterium]